MINFIDKISNNNRYKFLIVIAIFVAYLFSIFYADNLIVSIIGMSLMATICCFVYQKIKNNEHFSPDWFSVFAYLASWSLCDFLWNFVVQNKQDDILLAEALYLAPSFIALLIVIHIYYKCIKDTGSSQIITDAIFILILTISFFAFILFSDRFISNENSGAFLINSLYIALDILIMCACLIIKLSISNLKQSTALSLFLFSITIYSINDIIYGFYSIKGKEISNSLVDAIFYISFIIAMLSVFNINKKTHDFHFIISNEKITLNFVKKMLILLFTQVISAEYIEILDLTYMAFIFLLMLIYGILGNHISTISYNNDMLIKEKDIKQKLIKLKEQRINKLNNIHQRFMQLSRYDNLTEAFNRPYFLDQLSEMIATKTLSQCVSLYTIDINNFKTINDIYGYNIGDEVLIYIVKNLKTIISRNAIIGRFGGDDIAIAIKENIKQSDHNEFCIKILNKIQAPIHVNDYIIYLTANIGVSFTETSQIKVQDLISQSSMALKIAKDNISIPYFRHTKDLENENLRKHYIKILIDKSDFDKEFSLRYQPQFDIKTKQICAIETFIRWNSYEKGEIKPIDFMPIAEQTPIILLIGKWILQNSIKQIKEWNDKYNTNLKLSLNVSSQQIQNHKFAQEVKDIINKYNINPSLINFEIKQVKNILLESNTIENINQLKDLGSNIYLDDFGTGFSSISHFKQLKTTKIKIAKEFIINIQDDEVNQKIIASISNLAKKMGMKVIAKCIETKEQLEVLKELGCDEIQGFVWCKPLTADKFEEFLMQNLKSNNAFVV